MVCEKYDSSGIILSLVQDRLPHTVNILFALVLSLLQVDVGYDLFPACCLVQLTVLLSKSLLFLQVVSSPLFLLGLLATVELLELSSALCLSGILLVVLLLLLYYGGTLF